jgi:hypothetical protein
MNDNHNSYPHNPYTIRHHSKMDRRINARMDAHMVEFKNNIAAKFAEVRQKCSSDTNTIDVHKEYAEILGFIYAADKLKLSKEDFMKRKRIKNVVPVCDRCHAKRANGEQCTRRKKDESIYCGTHAKGTPHGTFDNLEQVHTSIKVDTWVQDIKGIMYHIDSMGNVYDPEDIVANIMNPSIIAKYVKNANGEYSIPTFN